MRPYVALLLYLWVVWGGSERLSRSCSWVLRRPEVEQQVVQYGVQINRVCRRVCGLIPTGVEGTAEKPVGGVGESSMPAQLRCSVRPSRAVSSTGNRIGSLTRILFGFHSPDPVIALAFLGLGDPLHFPGRN